MCSQSAVGPIYLTDHDETDKPHGVYCYRLDDLTSGVKVLRAAKRIIDVFRDLEIPRL